MNEYHLALQFWASLAALLLLGPFVVAGVRRGVDALDECLHGDPGDPASPLASVPSGPRPSSPG